MRLSLLPVLSGLAAVLFVAGCQRDNHPRLPDGPDSLFPSVGVSTISTVGGHAHGLAGRSAGDSGNLGVSVSGGTLRTTDDGVRSTPLSNFIGSVLDEGTITYSDLEGLLIPTIVAGVATFNLGADGLFLPRGVRIDLSDAPTVGTPVNEVVFNATDLIRIDGEIRTRRESASAVAVHLNTPNAGGVTVDGTINTSADNGQNAGDITLNASAGPVSALGRLRAEGGPATTTLDGGQGGDIGITAGAGDATLRKGSWRTHGLEGRVNGGDGGNITVTATGAAQLDFKWSMVSWGGKGVDGDGGTGGDVSITIDADVTWFSRAETWGGSTSDGTGGDAGQFVASTVTAAGILVFKGDGGASANGDGGQGMSATLLTQNTMNFDLVAYARGGSGDLGGGGGAITLDVTSLLEYVSVQAFAGGGSGTTQGGNGGSAYVTASGAAVLRHFELAVVANGGGSPMQGGIGGSGGINVAASTSQVSNVDLNIQANGGNGANAGNGGTAELYVLAGAAWGWMYASVNGGNSTAGIGGNGGQVNLLVDDGNLDFVVQGSANGGSGAGGSGGNGGTATLGNTVGAAAGTARVLGGMSAHGGGSDSVGGNGGLVRVWSGDAGASIENFSVQVHGASGPDGGNGGTFEADSSGAVALSGGSVDAGGGNGNASGQGGAGGMISLLTQDGALTTSTPLLARGGTGGDGGNGGNIELNADSDAAGDAGNIIASGALDARGGDAQGGTGGDGGSVTVLAASGGAQGSIQANASMRVNGGNGGPGGSGGAIELRTGGALVNVTNLLDATGGSDNDGGTIGVYDALQVTIAASARLLADGRGTGLAGNIDLDPSGAGPNNPALTIQPGATLSTRDGDGTDQSGTNIVLD